MNIKAVSILITFLIFTGFGIFSDKETCDPVKEGLISLDDGAHTYKLYLPEDFEKEQYRHSSNFF